MNTDGGGVTRLTHQPSTDVEPRWSPDGQWISFTRVEHEGPKVHIMRSDGSEQKFLVAGQGGYWSSCQLQAE